METYGFVYIWLDKKHKRYYIGCHWGTEDDGYVCSSKWMKQAYKRRPNDFRRRVLTRVFTSKKDMVREEDRFLRTIKESELGKRYYNLRNYSTGGWIEGRRHTDETRQLMREAQLRIGNRPPSMKGTKLSEEHKRKIRESNIGKNLGKKYGPPSEETRRKIGEANRAIMTGRKNGPLSEEHKRKISEVKRGKSTWSTGMKKFTNGIINKMFRPEEAPDGWTRVRK